MKELLKIQGGYPRQMDYLFNLQNELFTMNNSLFAGLGMDLALSGCAVTDHGNGSVDIASGLVYVGGEVLRFDGVSNLTGFTTKTLSKGPFVATDPKIFADQQAKNVYREAKAVVTERSSVLQLQIKNTNLYNLKDYISDTVSAADVKGAIRQIYDLDNTLLANFDSSGLGISARWNGWALMNGQNGTRDVQGKVLIGTGRFTDPLTGIQTVYGNGDSGGEKSHKLIVAEMPRHNHGSGRGPSRDRARGDLNTVGFNGSNYTFNADEWTAPAGDDLPHNNMQPYVVVYFIMKIA